MSSIWNATPEIEQLIAEQASAHHPHLDRASIWALVSDRPHIRDNRLVFTISQKCTPTEKLLGGHDFKIIFLSQAWALLTDRQREIAVNDALCRCGVKHLPQVIEVNGRRETVKDDLGRVIYTDQVAHDSEGRPKWCINRADAGLFFRMLALYGPDYCDEAHNIHQLAQGKPIRTPAGLFEVVDPPEETEEAA